MYNIYITSSRIVENVYRRDYVLHLVLHVFTTYNSYKSYTHYAYTLYSVGNINFTHNVIYSL